MKGAGLAGLLLLAGCADDPAHPPPLATVKQALVAGETLTCVETMIEIGLPIVGRLSAISYVRRTFECTVKYIDAGTILVNQYWIGIVP